MQRIPNDPPKIAPLKSDLHRVLWSVMVPVYNCSGYLVEALQSILQQDQGFNKMQIEVVDDCSTDANVEEIVKKIGEGRINYYRQNQNVGSLRNFETCINRASGQYIHLLHGDDKVEYGFYNRIEWLFKEFPEAAAAICGYKYIDGQSRFIRYCDSVTKQIGIIPNCLERLTYGQICQYACIVVKRSIYEDLGSFYGVTYGEDWIMWARIAKKYPVVYTPQVLAQYREHQTSISGIGFLTGKNVEEMKKVAVEISKLFPIKEQKKVYNRMRINYMHWITTLAQEIWKKEKNTRLVRKQIKLVMKGHINFSVFKRIVRLWISTVFNYS